MSSTPNFPILQNVGSGAGAPWHLVAEGDAAAAKNAGAVLAFKDAGGNLRYPTVDSQDRINVNTEGDDVVDLADSGDNAGSGTFVDLLTITLQNSTDYKKLDWVFSCFRDATFEIVWVDDVGGTDTETILATSKVGSGDYTDSNQMNRRFTTGATGVQELRVRAVNLNVTSQLEAALAVQEVQ